MARPKPFRLVVAGAGIVGVSTALHALKRGWDVTLVDPRGVAGGASSGNAGVIAVSECVPIGTPSTIKAVPGMLLSRSSPLHIRPSYLPRLLPWLMRMLWASTPSKVEQASKVLAELLDLALAAHHELAREAGVDGDLVRSGWLKVFEDERGFAAAQPEFDVMRRRGVRCDELDGAGIRGLEPSLGLPFSKGIFHAECHHVGDPLLYVQALGRLALHRGLKWRAEEVHGFDTSGGRVTAVQAAHGPIKADAVVIATGAWSKALAAMLGCTVPLDTERGYHMMLDTAECAVQLTRPVYWAEKSIVLSPMGGRVRVTSSVEFAGLKADPDFDLVLRCLPDVQRLLPGAALVPGSTWLGFRPSMPDSLPVIGPVPELSNAVLAFGHGHLGLTLGPITGKLVCDALDGEGAPKVLAPFKPARFATGG